MVSTYPRTRFTIKDITFSITESQKMFGIIGPNGSGKTTIHKILSLLSRRKSGNLVILGEENNCSNIITKIGSVPQKNLFWAHMTVD